MTGEPKSRELKSTGYELFILLLSLVSIFNLGVIWLNWVYPVNELVLGVLDIIKVRESVEQVVVGVSGPIESRE